MMNRFLMSLMLMLNTSALLASDLDGPTRGSYGYIANHMMEPVGGIIYFIQTAALLCGIGMIMGAFFKYGSYRKNPVAVTFGVPLVMFMTGLALIGLKFIPFVGLHY